ncbi:MAG: T9SS type A sorting domain-containing protein [Bacteroidales bacterium]|nr:T9SS type A sorting domain-containing protein [Bacteroidales bacterium]
MTENSEIDLENLPNGIYLINIIEEQNTTNLRIVIEK